MIETKIEDYKYENPRLFENYDKNLTRNLENKLKEYQLEPNFTDNAISILTKRYFKKDENGLPQEDVKMLVRRVAANVAYPDFHYGNEEQAYQTAISFYEMMAKREFMPNSPTLMNAGRKMQQLSACFVLPIEDSISDIFKQVYNTAMIHKSGGGTGFSFSRLRRKNDFVSSTYGKSSGTNSFIQAFDAATHAVNQGGFRRGANMAILDVTHPDILEFIHAKENEKDRKFANFNFSIALTDDFMNAVENNGYYVLMNPRSSKLYEFTMEDIKRDRESVRQGLISDLERPLIVEGDDVIYQNPIKRNLKGIVTEVEPKKVGKVDEKGRLTLNAKLVLEEIAQLAWKNGEPGVIFIDKINQYNPTPSIGRIESTNPCGEQPLLPYEACNLGSINLDLMVRDGKIDYEKLKRTVENSVHFLDNVVDMSNFPLEEIVNMVQGNRKIGLGVMGFADMLYKLGISYNSEQGLNTAEEIMKFIKNVSIVKSQKLAEERGPFPNFHKSIYANEKPRRNATITTVAPTGSISIISNASGAIEPLFDLVYTHTDADDQKRKFINEPLKRDLDKRGIDSNKTIEELKEGKNLQELDFIPEDIKKIYVTTKDISVDYHVNMQAIFQKYTDNAVSKTINMPNSATVEDVKKAYLMAYKLGCKGITVYRDGSRHIQVLESAKKDKTLDQKVKKLDRGTLKKLEEVIPTSYLKQKTPWGHLHTKISVDKEDNYHPIQIFTQLGKAGEAVSADLEAITRLSSMVLRLGGNMKEHIISQLEGIGSQLKIPTLDGGVVSLPDGIAKCLTNYLYIKEKVGIENLLLGNFNLEEIKKEKIKEKNSKQNNKKENNKKENNEEEYAAKCPDCGSKILTESGCFSCSDIGCGWSQC